MDRIIDGYDASFNHVKAIDRLPRTWMQQRALLRQAQRPLLLVAGALGDDVPTGMCAR